MNELAKRLVACKHFWWMPGMRAVGRKGSPDAWFTVEEPLHKLHGDWRDALPDLTDPGTMGCLLALVRKAWDDPHVYVLACASDWFTVCSPNAKGGKWLALPPIDGKSEAEALVAALEAAP